MSDKIDDIAEKSFPSCTCVLYSSNKPRVGFGSHAMYFYDYDKVIRYENIEKISYGYKIILSCKYKSVVNDYSKEVISFARGVSHSYEMAIFLAIIADVSFFGGTRLNELCSIRLQSCNGKTVRDIIG